MSINVLVYNGPGVSQSSLTHTIKSLRTLLHPNYTVSSISPESLSKDPWPPSCALLVIPGGRDLPYASSLERANPRIREYVRGGGSFLGICAGAYYASARVEWEVGTSLEVVGPRPLSFYPGTAEGCMYKGFAYESEAGARVVDVSADDGEVYHGIYYNGGGFFSKATLLKAQGVRVLATYPEGNAAAVLCDVGQGRAILWGPHLEYSLDLLPTSALLGSYSSHEVVEMERRRWHLLRRTLGLLALSPSTPSADRLTSRLPSPLPQVLICSPSRPDYMDKYRAALAIESASSIPYIFEDALDTFHIYPSASFSALVKVSRSKLVTEEDLSKLSRDLSIFEGGLLPNTEDTPFFDFLLYFEALTSIRLTLGLKSLISWGMGETLIYGELITSTQTLFDKNPKLMRAIPAPTLSLATQQLSGRGRGSNVWLSPQGCLQFSLLVRPPSDFRPASLIFVQYLFGLATIEACRHIIPEECRDRIKLKWPNDLYAVGVEGDLRKIGGILVTTNFSGGSVDIVIGCGLNVLNPLPTTSLSHLMPPDRSPLTLEVVVATIMGVFEQMWDAFIGSRGSFLPFMDLYLDRWLHTDQEVTLTTTSPHQRVRILGITPDYGLLRTISIGGRSSAYFDLQPDGNSFDMLAGLIRMKQ